MSVKVAVLIPCYNEEKSIKGTVEEARKHLPKAEVYVYDNNSTDKTAEIAAEAGAIVRPSPDQGKGNTIRRMFADIDADVYVITDGDMTYDLSCAPELVRTLIDNQLDMVIGARKEKEKEAYPTGHRFGNFALTQTVQILFGKRIHDLLSGYRVFSKRFVKTFPARSPGFEIETELTVFTCTNRLPFTAVETDYFARPEGSISKLSTYKDGFRVLRMIFRLLREERPLFFYTILTLILTAIPFIFPTYPGISFFTLLTAAFCFFTGIISSAITKQRRENCRRSYLSYPLYQEDK